MNAVFRDMHEKRKDRVVVSIASMYKHVQAKAEMHA
jgi:hypothetical protein